MAIELVVAGRPAAPCVRYQVHVHTEITRDRGAADPRVPGRSRHEDALISRMPDGLSPLLAACCAAGRLLDEVRIIVRHRPPEPRDAEEEERATFVLGDVYVVSVLSSMEDGAPLETVALSYRTIRWVAPPHLGGDDASWEVYPPRPASP